MSHRNRNKANYCRNPKKGTCTKKAFGEKPVPITNAFMATRFVEQELMRGKCTHLETLLNVGTQMDKDHALEWLSYHGKNKEIIQTIKAGADVNSNDNVAIQMAALGGHTECVATLIEHGADVNSCSEAALLNAITNKHIETVKYLIGEDDSNNKRCDIHILNDLPLMTAIDTGTVEIVEMLIQAGANIHTMQEYPLTKAMEMGRLDLVHTLIKHGSNLKDVRHRQEISPEILDFAEKNSIQ